MKELITLNNSQKKLIKSLHSKKYRQKEKLFLAEGLKICTELFNNKLEQTEMIVVPTNLRDKELKLAKEFLKANITIYKTQQSIFNQICDSISPQGILGIVKFYEQKIISEKSFIAIENISDPGNLGTIIRTADWFGYKQVIINNESVDIYNSKTVRSSMGSIFRVNTIQVDNLNNFILKNFKNHKIYLADLNSNQYLEDLPKTKKHGLIFGNESNGLSKDIIDTFNNHYSIRGFGKSESLNLAVSAAISMYYFTHK